MTLQAAVRWPELYAEAREEERSSPAFGNDLRSWAPFTHLLDKTSLSIRYVSYTGAKSCLGDREIAQSVNHQVSFLSHASP